MLSREPNTGLMKNKRKEKKDVPNTSTDRGYDSGYGGRRVREGLMVKVYVWVCWRVQREETEGIMGCW